MKDKLEETKNMQWVGSEGSYSVMSGGQILDKLPAGAYTFSFNALTGPIAKKMDLKDEELLCFEQGQAPKILKEVERFWTLGDNYTKLGVPYRRGILMHGIPGTGKSGIVRIICNDIIANDGLVAYCTSASSFSRWIPILNDLEPNRRLVVVFEDLDNLIDYDEHDFLQLLDGIGNDRSGMLFIATTNFLDNIPERIYRPSRFDYLIEIQSPNADVREQYVTHLCGKYGEEVPEGFVEASDDLPFAHVKEMLISCLLYGYSVDESAERMRLHGSLDDDDDDDDDDE